MTSLMLSMPVRSTCQMNRRIVGTVVEGRSILCVVLIISYHEAIGQPTHFTHRNYVCPRSNCQRRAKTQCMARRPKLLRELEKSKMESPNTGGWRRIV